MTRLESRRLSALVLAVGMFLALVMGAFFYAQIWYLVHPAPSECYEQGQVVMTDYCLNAHYGGEWDENLEVETED